MKNIIYGLFVAIALGTVSCTGFDEAAKSEKVTPLQVSVNLTVSVEKLASVKNLTLKLDNYTDGYHYSKKLNDTQASIDGVVPGIYTVSVSGTAYDTDGAEFYVNGNAVNKALYAGVASVQITMRGLKVSPLVFKEIYFAGSKLSLIHI